MPPGSPPDPGRRRALEALLVDLGPQLCRGPKLRGRRPSGPSPRPESQARTNDPPRSDSQRIPSGFPDVDALVGGGFPKGGLSEISGPASSGRTSLALALLARTTQADQLVAVVDGADAFDPLSAESAGVDLDRVLWARAPGWREALRCCERLLETEGIPLVLLDLANDLASHRDAPRQTSPRKPGRQHAPEAAWLRLARKTRASSSVLVVLSTLRLTGSHAEIALEMQNANARFRGSPALLEELEIHAVLARHRALPTERSVSVRLATRPAA